jgi:hypothetical protein
LIIAIHAVLARIDETDYERHRAPVPHCTRGQRWHDRNQAQRHACDVKRQSSREGLRIFPAVKHRVSDLKSYDRECARAQYWRHPLGIVTGGRHEGERFVRTARRFQFDAVAYRRRSVTRSRRRRTVYRAPQVSTANAVGRRIDPMVHTSIASPMPPKERGNNLLSRLDLSFYRQVSVWSQQVSQNALVAGQMPAASGDNRSGALQRLLTARPSPSSQW